MRRTRPIALAAAALLLVSAPDAHAFRQTTTCSAGGGQYACEPGEEPLPVYWPHAGVYYHINEVGSDDFPTGPDGRIGADLRRAIIDSFAAWNEPACSKLSLRYRGLTPVREAQYVGDSCFENINGVSWRESWPYASKTAYAITSVTFNPNTGEISDADMELNGESFAFANLEEGSSSAMVDVRNTVTHEAGHFLGLDHTSVTEATMYASAPIGELDKASLHPDDVEGLCSIYPDDGSPPRFDPDTRQCTLEGQTCLASVVGRRGGRGHLPSGLVLLALAGLWARRRGSSGS